MNNIKIFILSHNTKKDFFQIIPAQHTEEVDVFPMVQSKALTPADCRMSRVGFDSIIQLSARVTIASCDT